MPAENLDNWGSSIVQSTSLFTICARNYLAHAIVLGQSLAVADPGTRLTVFLLDDLPVDRAGLEHIDIVPAETIMPQAEWHHRQCFYDVLELATSIKPTCFLHMLDKGYDFAIYLDPDILIFRPLEVVYSALEDGNDIVLTPHLLTPLPSDGRYPDDLAIMQSGTYNLGFAAFAGTECSRSVLNWWDRHLRTRGQANPSGGMFTDQKWANFFPGFVAKTFLIRHPGYNIAYWNLHERTPQETNGTWSVLFSNGNESEAVFFHFSGFGPWANTLSKHENRFERYPPGDTNLLLARYAAALEAAGFSQHSKQPIPVPRFEAGVAWDPVFRALYRTALRTNVSLKDPLKGSSFLSYAIEKENGDHVSRYLRSVMRLRGDLATAYDDGRNHAGLVRWLLNSGPAQIGIDPAVFRLLGLGADKIGGVNVVGYLSSHLGIGEAARNAISALRAVGIEVQARDISNLAGSPTGNYLGAGDIPSARRLSHALTILVVNADATPSVCDALTDELSDTFVIGYWAWETPEFPEQWCDRFDFVNEVWVASSFIAEAVREKSTVPVVVIPYMVAPPKVAVDRGWLISRRPEIDNAEFIFIFLFDVASVPFRKNPEGAITAFVAAFLPDEPVRLVIKVLNGDRDPALLDRLGSLGSGRRITVWDETLEDSDRFRLLASADAFVSLHRAEGFGLSIAEAMAYGLAVVTTAWSGNCDFTNEENAALVAYDLVPIDRQHGPYPAGTVWAEPRLDDAARQMRRIYDDPGWRESIGAAGTKTIAAKLSSQAVGAVMKARIGRLSGSTRSAQQKTGRAKPARLVDPTTNAELMPTITAIKLVALDAWRLPAFYIARAPRLPRLVLSDGFSPLIRRAAMFAQTRKVTAPPTFLFQSIVSRITQLLRRFGLVAGGRSDRRRD
jgi:glycosyltransferase involved in cell wall biosynthesis